MKQTLQLKLGQHLTMTPQLQQAIRLLQLSSLELNIEVQDALDSNMMLELDDESGLNQEEQFGDAAPERIDTERLDEAGENDTVESTTKDIPEDLPVDSDWEEIYDSIAPAGTLPSVGIGAQSEFEGIRSADDSLREHLLWQLNLLPLTDTDKAIAFAIVDMLSDDGYLESDLEALCETVNGQDEAKIGLDEVAAVLKQVQGLDPVGVAARDLRECLLLQLGQVDPSTPWLAEAKQVCDKYLSVLGSRDYPQVMRRLKIAQDDLKQVLDLIQSMNPRPGASFNEKPPEYVIPDVYVRKDKGRWKVELNSESLPQIRVNPYYASMIRRADNSPDNSSLKSHLQEAKWFIKSLQSRSETLLRVATAIVERQQAFLEYGDEAMKPLVLHDIAEVLEMHESTISRVTTRKYMHSPRGIFELKYFFSSHVGTTLGGEASSIAIRAVIKKIIAAENSQKPLSDSKLANLLSDQGVKVARRTVAKYREAMQIPPSNERKKLS
ncbi:MAG: RNA polymerase factor sigma-54 [Proteobacteria bacterium]|nr:MAG: RNA polymerase factor sigma-54 [Pseudomonadota bacterium]